MYGLALDLGTSGFRIQAIDLEQDVVQATVITVRHPLPGANVMDHLHFCLENGTDLAQELMVGTVNKLLEALNIDLSQVVRLAICGNPIQLSIFQNIEVRDLAFAGERAKQLRGIVPPNRDAKIIKAADIKGLNLDPEVDVCVPPAVKHEIGADALAMMVKSKLLERDEIALVTDYGTNAEMALKVGDDIYTGSAAAGPAIEGQFIKFGMLASPGAISNVEDEDGDWRCYVLDEEITPKEGDLVDVNTGEVWEEGEMHERAKGVTGTGVVAATAVALGKGSMPLASSTSTGSAAVVLGSKEIYVPPKIKTEDGCLHLQDGIYLTEDDLSEAGKAFGAMRAGHFTLLEHAGIKFEDLDAMYMSGASGTYVDAKKAQIVGMVPATPKRIYQIGNTSLAMAGDIARDPSVLDELQTLAKQLRAEHIMFATDPVFETIYMQELAYWTEGMPMQLYNEMVEKAGIQPLPMSIKDSEVHRIVVRDIPDLGVQGLTVIRDIGITLEGEFEGCIKCRKCEKECPEDALTCVEEGDRFLIHVNSDRCNGTACKRCERACPEHVFRFDQLVMLH